MYLLVQLHWTMRYILLGFNFRWKVLCAVIWMYFKVSAYHLVNTPVKGLPFLSLWDFCCMHLFPLKPGNFQFIFQHKLFAFKYGFTFSLGDRYSTQEWWVFWKWVPECGVLKVLSGLVIKSYLKNKTECQVSENKKVVLLKLIDGICLF